MTCPYSRQTVGAIYTVTDQPKGILSGDFSRCFRKPSRIRGVRLIPEWPLCPSRLLSGSTNPLCPGLPARISRRRIPMATVPIDHRKLYNLSSSALQQPECLLTYYILPLSFLYFFLHCPIWRCCSVALQSGREIFLSPQAK